MKQQLILTLEESECYLNIRALSGCVTGDDNQFADINNHSLNCLHLKHFTTSTIQAVTLSVSVSSMIRIQNGKQVLNKHIQIFVSLQRMIILLSEFMTNDGVHPHVVMAVLALVRHLHSLLLSQHNQHKHLSLALNTIKQSMMQEVNVSGKASKEDKKKVNRIFNWGTLT